MPEPSRLHQQYSVIDSGTRSRGKYNDFLTWLQCGLQAMRSGDHLVVDKDLDMLTNMAFLRAEALPDQRMQALQYRQELLHSVCLYLDLTFASTIGT